MVKDDKINIRLEVCRDKNSGKLSIAAHFDSNAPNVVIDKDGICWVPTYEEKEFINEAFQLVPADVQYTTPVERNQRIEDKREIKSFNDLPPLKRHKEPTVFEPTDEINRNDTQDKDVFQRREEYRENRYEPVREHYKPQEKELRPKEEEKIIVEADSEAIDAALKKHLQDDDSSFVEVDEQTIIDKVLSQKKKGKWNKK